jgi:thiosulfate/3-mercaptopyruvate sulfurtransferase
MNTARRHRFETPRSETPRTSTVLPVWLEPRLATRNLSILDVRASYRAGHVPGAVPLDVRRQLFDGAGNVVSPAELALVMSQLGVDDGDTIVLVDEGPPAQALTAASVLARYGHPDVYLLDGGHTRWAAERRAITRDVPRRPAGSFTARTAP